MHWEILDETRTKFLPNLAFTKDEGFYLAGGTALAIYIGHRDSIDFDFFKKGDFDTDHVFDLLQKECSGCELTIVQKEKNTLSVLVNKKIKLSFFGYKYPLIDVLTDTTYLNIASIKDIAVMKLGAITSRSLEKDYVDLYYILKDSSLNEILDDARKKIPELDQNVILKALVYFEDVEGEHIMYKEGYEIKFDDVKNFLRSIVTTYMKE